MTQLLAIDASTTSTGLTILKIGCRCNGCTDKEFTIERISSIVPPKKMKKEQRIDMMVGKIEEIIIDYEIEIVAIENFAYGGFQTITMAQVCGIIQHYARLHGCTIHMIPPTTAKKQSCGHGDINKVALQEYLMDEYKVTFNNLDESDALAVGIACIEKYL